MLVGYQKLSWKEICLVAFLDGYIISNNYGPQGFCKVDYAMLKINKNQINIVLKLFNPDPNINAWSYLGCVADFTPGVTPGK